MPLMEELIDGFANQLEKAIEIGVNSQIANNKIKINNIVISGMGGSGIGGDIVSQLTKDTLKVPIEVVKGYSIPRYVDESTLFIVSSYSGNTEETLACLNEAIERNAIVCVITSGGTVLDKANEIGLEKIVIPGGTGCPRANVGLSFTALMFMLYKYEMISNDFIPHLKKGILLIRSEKDSIIESAKNIANKIKDNSITIYSDDMFAPVALRFQQQMNENAKQIAHVNTLPEMNHNELVGWSSPSERFANSSVILIKNILGHKSVQSRIEICEGIFKDKCNSIIVLETKGENQLVDYVYLIHLIDWVSYFVALANGVDPFPVDNIDYLKSRLASQKG